MTKRLSAAAVMALKEALSTIYWYKDDLRGFLSQVLSNAAVLATLNWDSYKRQIAADLVDRLCHNQDKHLGDLTRLCREVCNISSFGHLEQLVDGALKAKRAKKAVEQLRQLVHPHEEAVAEKDAISERQRQLAEKLRTNQAIRQKLGEIREMYEVLVTSLHEQQRGFDLEKVMYDLFDLFDLDPKASFRNTGEQIDGAFSLEGTDYLFEGKWLQKPIGTKDLDAFSKKVERKLENTLGLFLSISGFSDDGVSAHTSARASIILMDGADLMAVLEERIDFVSLLLSKKRHASQTGKIYLRIHEVLG